MNNGFQIRIELSEKRVVPRRRGEANLRADLVS